MKQLILILTLICCGACSFDHRLEGDIRLAFPCNGEISDTHVEAFLDGFGAWKSAFPYQVSFEMCNPRSRNQIEIWDTPMVRDEIGYVLMDTQQLGKNRAEGCLIRVLKEFEEAATEENLESYKMLAIHEAGHCLGLVHSPDKSSVMYEVPEVSEPSALDLKQMRDLYND